MKPLVYKYTHRGQTMRSLLIETRKFIAHLYLQPNSSILSLKEMQLWDLHPLECNIPHKMYFVTIFLY